jgi:hypothetical protein
MALSLHPSATCISWHRVFMMVDIIYTKSFIAEEEKNETSHPI